MISGIQPGQIASQGQSAKPSGLQNEVQQAATAPKFGEVMDGIQAKYGARPEPARQIKKTLGKDDFLKIMLTQMKNQDPTNPFKAEQMAAEVAQFTSVEQLSNINQNISKLGNQSKPLEQMAMTNMIGKVVTIDRNRFPHTEGDRESLGFYLPRDAAAVHVTVLDETGEPIFEKDIGSQKAGEVRFSWDGVKANSLPAKTGSYVIKVDARDSKDLTIEANPKAQAKIIGVTFEGAEPVFLVGDAKRQEKITMRNIVRVEMDTQALSADQGIKPVDTGEAKPKNFFSFQKGVGSSNLDHMTPEVANAIERFQQEKGFPNGLSQEKGGEE